MPSLRIPVTDRDHVRGAANAPITLVEYGDFECPFCGQLYWVLRELESTRPDLRVVFRHFPLAEAHPLAMIAGEAAEAAAAQGRFWQMHDLLFENQPAFYSDDLFIYARQLELDVDAFALDLRGHRHRDRLLEDFMGGVRSGVNGTPGLFIDGEPYHGRNDIASLSRALTLREAHGSAGTT